MKPQGEGCDGTKAVLHELRGVEMDLTLDGFDAAKFRRFHKTLRLLVLYKLNAGTRITRICKCSRYVACLFAMDVLPGHDIHVGVSSVFQNPQWIPKTVK